MEKNELEVQYCRQNVILPDKKTGKNSSAFSLAEMMVVMLIMSIVLAAMAPMITTRIKADQAVKGLSTPSEDNNPWKWVEGSDTDAYSQASKNMIGQNEAQDTDNAMLIINKGEDDKDDILFKSADDIIGRIKMLKTGMLIGTKSDTEELGQGAVSVGFNNIASGESSIALGDNAAASNSYSTALGHNAKALGGYSIALGHVTKASGISSVAVCGTASGPDSVAVGIAEATNRESTAIGYTAEASGLSSIALGYRAIASGESSTAVGCDVKATGYRSIAVGDYAKASGNGSLAVDGTASGISSKALGGTASGDYSRALGGTASGESSIAIGHIAEASGRDSIALGYLVSAQGEYSVAIGYNAVAKNKNDFVLGSSSHKVQIPGNLEVKGNLTYNGTNVTSDKRLKYINGENTNGLDVLKQIKVYNFTFKKDKDKEPRVGVIAQELQKILPDAVKKGSDGFLTIRIDDIIYTLVNAVKELDRKVSELTQTLKQVQAEQKRINQRLDALEHKSVH